MKLRHIEIFHAIRMTGSVSRAAQLLSISQSAVSKTLGHAELQLGFKLFERVKGRLKLTPEAQSLAPEIEKMMLQLEHIRSLTANIHQHPAGSLKIGCLPSLGLHLIPQAVAVIRQRYPDINIEITTGHEAELVRKLRSREINIAFTFKPAEYADCAISTIARVNMVLTGPHSKNKTRPGDVDFRKLITYSAGDPVTRIIESMAVPHQFTNQVKVETYYVAAAIAENEDRLAIVDEFTARFVLRDKSRYVYFDPPITLELVAICREQGPASTLEKQFIGGLRRLARQEHANVPGIRQW